MVEKVAGYCKTAMSFVYDSSLSIYELILKTIEKQDEIIDSFNSLEESVSNSLEGFQDDLNKKEDSSIITNARKLSSTGDFTGTLCNNSISACDLVTLARSNENQIDYIIDQIQDGSIIGRLLDGGIFGDTDIRTNYDGGGFTDAVIVNNFDGGVF